MQNEKFGCKYMKCPQIQSFVPITDGYYCCYGCDDMACKSRCMNSRDKCNSATDTTSQPQRMRSGSNRHIKQHAHNLWKFGKTQEEIAKICGLSQSTISRYIAQFETEAKA